MYGPVCSWNLAWKVFFLSVFFLSCLTSFQSKIDTVAQSIPLERIFSLMLISREKWDLWNIHPPDSLPFFLVSFCIFLLSISKCWLSPRVSSCVAVYLASSTPHKLLTPHSHFQSLLVYALEVYSQLSTAPLDNLGTSDSRYPLFSPKSMQRKKIPLPYLPKPINFNPLMTKPSCLKSENLLPGLL